MSAKTNAEIAAAFEELGDLYELDGAVSYRVIAYRTAAKAVRDASVSVMTLTREGRVTELPGIGKTLEEKLYALDETGDIPAAQRLERVDAELRVQQPHPLWPDARQTGDVDQPGRELGAQLFGRGDRARVEQREDLLFERLADARQLAGASRAGERGDRHGCVAHGPRGAPVRLHAMDYRAVELVQVAELIESLCDRGV